MGLFKALKDLLFPDQIVENKVVLPLVAEKPKVKKTTKPQTTKPKAKKPAAKKTKVKHVSEE